MLGEGESAVASSGLLFHAGALSPPGEGGFFSFEQIAASPYRMQQLPHKRRINFAPKRVDQYVEGAGSHFSVLSPYSFDQCASGNHSRRILRQQFQQQVLSSSQI